MEFPDAESEFTLVPAEVVDGSPRNPKRRQRNPRGALGGGNAVGLVPAERPAGRRTGPRTSRTVPLAAARRGRESPVVARNLTPGRGVCFWRLLPLVRRWSACTRARKGTGPWSGLASRPRRRARTRGPRGSAVPSPHHGADGAHDGFHGHADAAEEPGCASQQGHAPTVRWTAAGAAAFARFPHSPPAIAARHTVCPPRPTLRPAAHAPAAGLPLAETSCLARTTWPRTRFSASSWTRRATCPTPSWRRSCRTICAFPAACRGPTPPLFALCGGSGGRCCIQPSLPHSPAPRVPAQCSRGGRPSSRDHA